MKIKNIKRKECGQIAIVGFAGGFVLAHQSNIILVRVIGDGLFLLGFLYGIVWVYKLIKKEK